MSWVGCQTSAYVICASIVIVQLSNFEVTQVLAQVNVGDRGERGRSLEVVVHCLQWSDEVEC